MLEKDVKQHTEHLMWKHGLIEKGWKFRFSKGTFTFGSCNYKKKIISMSRPLCKENTKERVTRTILHEIAHALVGYGHHHDRVWKAKCIEIGGDGVVKWSRDDTVAIKDTTDSFTHNGIKYVKGDTIQFYSYKTMERKNATLIGFKKRNHKYPIIVKCDEKRWKISFEHLR